MKLVTFFTATALTVFTQFAFAGTPAGSSNESAQGNIECTQVTAAQLHLSCKLANAAGAKSELDGSLINFDVLNADGKVIASGNGTTVNIDNTKLAADEEYSVVVYAIVNGVVESQTFTRKNGGDGK